MKIKFAFLLPLAVLAAGAFSSPAKANPEGDRPTLTPAIVAQRSERSAPSLQALASESIQKDNYVGVGGSSDGAVVNGKYELFNNFSLRPEVFTNTELENGDRGVSFFAPVTYDFSIGQRFQPFIGAGAGVSTGDETELEFVTTAGADLQLGNRYAINASVNYLPLNEQRVDFVAGLGYRF